MTSPANSISANRYARAQAALQKLEAQKQAKQKRQEAEDAACARESDVIDSARGSYEVTRQVTTASSCYKNTYGPQGYGYYLETTYSTGPVTLSARMWQRIENPAAARESDRRADEVAKRIEEERKAREMAAEALERQEKERTLL